MGRLLVGVGCLVGYHFSGGPVRCAHIFCVLHEETCRIETGPTSLKWRSVEGGKGIHRLAREKKCYKNGSNTSSLDMRMKASLS